MKLGKNWTMVLALAVIMICGAARAEDYHVRLMWKVSGLPQGEMTVPMTGLYVRSGGRYEAIRPDGEVLLHERLASLTLLERPGDDAPLERVDVGAALRPLSEPVRTVVIPKRAMPDLNKMD